MKPERDITAGPPTGAPGGGPVLDTRAFETIAAIAYREAGLAIAPGKAAMVRTRLARRLRALNLTSFDAYCDLVTGPRGSEELGFLISALTTNVSHFFREEHHFKTLREKVLPPLFERMKSGHKVRIWSAGCSNGQEPYSIAMTALNAGLRDGDFRILATDIDPNVIAHARAGRYPANMIEGLPADMRSAYFSHNAQDDSWSASARLKSLITFNRLNLLEDWPMAGRFDAIFCRNVVIYFDAQTQDRLWRKFADRLTPDGWLFLGHSERVSETQAALFRNCGVTTYQKQGGPAPAAPGRA